MSAEQHIHLFSNTNASDTQSQFTTHLAESIEIDRDKYQIGLAEIIYKHSFSLFDSIDDRIVKYSGGSFKIADRFYEDATSLIEEINRKFTDHGLNVNMMLNDDSNVLFSCKEKSVTFTPFISEILGFVEDGIAKTIFNDEVYTGRLSADVNAGHNLMFVYCNLVQESLIGNTRSQLLRVLPIEGKDGSMVPRPFNPILYKDLKLNYLNPITITIKNELGGSFRFKSGIVTVVLSLARKI